MLIATPPPVHPFLLSTIYNYGHRAAEERRLEGIRELQEQRLQCHYLDFAFPRIV